MTKEQAKKLLEQLIPIQNELLKEIALNMYDLNNKEILVVSMYYDTKNIAIKLSKILFD